MNEKPIVKLLGIDGNVFSVIGRVSKALTKAGLNNEREQFVASIESCLSYDEVLQLAFEYCDVEGEEEEQDNE